MDILERDLQGLKARYELHDGSKRQYKCNFLVRKLRRWKIPDLNQPVEKFFQETHKVKLSQQRLPCLWHDHLHPHGALHDAK